MKAVYDKLPKLYKEKLESEANYADIDQFKSETVNAIFSFFILSVFLSVFFLGFSLPIKATIGVIGGLILGFGVPWMYMSLRAERRKTKMEKTLPDALKLVSSNTRSGHTLEKAFLLSARDEFGPLADELRLTAMDMYGGRAVEEALEEMESRIKSELFQETLKLLIDGIKAGGDKADLLESSAEDIRNSLELRDEIKSSIRMYVIFIIMVAVIGAPILFSVSVYMAEVTTDMWSGAGIGEMDGGGVSSQIGFDIEFAAPQVDVDFFNTFAYMAISTTNIFAALIISEINNGNVKNGIKYAPLFVTVSIVLYTVVNWGIGQALSGM